MQKSTLLHSSDLQKTHLGNGSEMPLNTDYSKGITELFTFFPYVIHTFQYMRDSKSIVRYYSSKQQALEEATSYNKQGYDVYFMPNEGTGVIPPGKKTARCQEAVKYISKCFIDTDNCPFKLVEDYLTSIQLDSHLEIESSTGRFHVYFFIDPILPTPENIQKWRAIQNILHRLGDPSKSPKDFGTDSTMSDYAKLLRVPGFQHIKKACKVIVAKKSYRKPYTLDELYNLTNASQYTIQSKSSVSEHTTVPSLDGPIYNKGERFSAIQKFALHVANDRASDETKLAIFTKFVRTKINHFDNEYFENDNLTPRSLSLFTSALNKVSTENQHRLEVLDASLDNISKSKVTPWLLPDEFYLTAPNGFGDVVRQVMENSSYPDASLAFGTFIAGLSLLKSRTHFTPGGSSPALYIINAAPTGYGKNDPMTMLQNTLSHIGLGRLIQNDIRSHRGILTHLSDNNSMGLFIIDEVSHLFKTIQSDDAASYMAEVSKWMLDLYTAGARKEVRCAKIGNSNSKKGDSEIILRHPAMALCGYCTRDQFFTMFTAKSVTSGLFQRIIPIVVDVQDNTKQNEHANKQAIINSPLFKLDAPIGAQELVDESLGVEPIQAIERIRVRWNPEVKKDFTALTDEFRAKYVHSCKNVDTEHKAGLYTRVAEQIERMSTALCVGDEIDRATYEFCKTFILSRHNATLAIAESTVLAGAGAENEGLRRRVMDCLIAKLAEVRDTGESAIAARVLFHSIKRAFVSYAQFKFILGELREMGKVSIISDYKSFKKGAKPCMAVTLDEVIDE